MCCLCQLGGWSATCRVSLLTVNTIEGWSGHLYLLRVEGRRQRGGVARAERLRDVHDRVQDLRRVRRVQRARAVALHQSEVSTWSRDRCLHQPQLTWATASAQLRRILWPRSRGLLMLLLTGAPLASAPLQHHNITVNIEISQGIMLCTEQC